MGCNGLYWALLGLTGLCCTFLVFTGWYSNLTAPGWAWLHWTVLGLAVLGVPGDPLWSRWKKVLQVIQGQDGWGGPGGVFYLLIEDVVSQCHEWWIMEGTFSFWSGNWKTPLRRIDLEFFPRDNTLYCALVHLREALVYPSAHHGHGEVHGADGHLQQSVRRLQPTHPPRSHRGSAPNPSSSSDTSKNVKPSKISFE